MPAQIHCSRVNCNLDTAGANETQEDEIQEKKKQSKQLLEKTEKVSQQGESEKTSSAFSNKRSERRSRHLRGGSAQITSFQKAQKENINQEQQQSPQKRKQAVLEPQHPDIIDLEVSKNGDLPQKLDEYIERHQ